VPSTEFGGNSKNMDCARHKQILLCLTHPPVRAQIPAVFRRYYKTAGVAPLNQNIKNRKGLRADCVCKEPFIENFESVGTAHPYMKPVMPSRSASCEVASATSSRFFPLAISTCMSSAHRSE